MILWPDAPWVRVRSYLPRFIDGRFFWFTIVERRTIGIGMFLGLFAPIDEHRAPR